MYPTEEVVAGKPEQDSAIVADTDVVSATAAARYMAALNKENEMTDASRRIQKTIDIASERALAEIRLLADAARKQIVCQYKFSNRSAGQRRRWAKTTKGE